MLFISDLPLINMDHEKYPNYFLAVIFLYLIIFVTALGYFVIPAASFAADYGDYYLISLLVFSPLILLAIYTTNRIEFLWGKEKILRTLITAFTVIDFVFVLYMSILLI